MKKKVYPFVISGLLLLSWQSAAAVIPPYFMKIYQLALENDDKVHAITLKAESTEFQVRQAKSVLYPDIQLQGGYSRNDYKYNPKYNQGSIEQGLFNATIQMSESIYDPRNYASIHVARAKYVSAREQLAVQKVELAQTVLPLYLEMINRSSRIQFMLQNMDFNKSKWQKAKKLWQLHLAGQADVLLAKVAYDNAKIELQKERAALKLVTNKLKRYTGNEKLPIPDMRVFNTKQLGRRIHSLEKEVSSFSLIRENNPYIRYAQANSLVAKLQFEQAKSDYWPKIGFTASYSVYDTDTPDSQNSYENTRRLGVNVSVPLYSGGRTTAQENESQLLYRSALASKADTEKNVTEEWQDAQVKFENAVELLPLYRQAIDSSELSLEVQQKKYEKGLVSVIELNEAKNKLFEAKFHYIDNLTSILDAYIKLLSLNNQLSDLQKIDELFSL